MSWIQKLYETYENCQAEIGIVRNDNEVPLLPICHTTQKAHIEITLDQHGNFKRSRVIPKNEARTIIPCTESSGGRTSGEAAHPLCDKLQYVASDYKKYGGEKESFFLSYQDTLSNWCQHDNNIKIHSVLKYIKKGNIIHDLIEDSILFADKDNKLMKQNLELSKSKDILNIFSLLPGKYNINDEIETWQADAFIRWAVEIHGDAKAKLCEDHELYRSWIDYYASTRNVKGLCFVTGKNDFTAEQHPAKIRNDGDKAKLISSNDSNGFTFRGRFIDSKQTCEVSFKTTQKAHNVLRWLISRQGFKRGDQAIVAWSTVGKEIPQPTDDAFLFIWGNDLQIDENKKVYTAQELGLRLKKRIAGYGKEIGDTKDVIIMALDSATPGRMAIIYYRELSASDFLQRIDIWHNKCTWLHHYRFTENKSEKNKKVYLPFIGAPAPDDIAEAAYGSKVDDKLRKSTVERILPCIIDGQQIPRDIVESAIRRASNRLGLENWDWSKTLTIACALFRKYNDKEKYDMALDVNRKTRDYLYGRLLAIADRIEESALYKANEDRPTTATRLMQRFADHPYTTWKTIEHALVPYRIRLGGRLSSWWQWKIDEVKDSFITTDDFTNDKPLSGEYLLSYSCQRMYKYPDDKETI